VQIARKTFNILPGRSSFLERLLSRKSGLSSPIVTPSVSSTSRRGKGEQAIQMKEERVNGNGVARTAALGLAVIGVVIGVLGSGAELAGASTHSQSGFSYESYVGGHGKAKSLSPITIGIVNQQTATDAPAPEWTIGAEIAQQYLNQHTGGIDGHPIKLLLCKIATTVADATTCGQEFADNAGIDAVAAGPIDVGNTALESALKTSKKPLFFGISLSTVDEKDPDGYILYGDVTHIEAPMATFAKENLHVKSVSITYPENIPAEVQSADIIADALKYEGGENRVQGRLHIN